VCGPTTYENLENWATGQQHNVALPPPMYVVVSCECGRETRRLRCAVFCRTQEDIEVKGRVTGFRARQQRQLEQTGKAAPKKVQQDAPVKAREVAAPPPPPPATV